MVERRVAGAPELQPWMQNVVDGMSLRWEQCDFSCQSVTPFSAQALSLALWCDDMLYQTFKKVLVLIFRGHA